ncbi:MAG TPA: endonuclease/exonuclease/phosphatase family protein [Pirellulales bacterium]|nr:endonuclease/exonuclease/phosphatase family protein [Pirellulales bacterium]
MSDRRTSATPALSPASQLALPSAPPRSLRRWATAFALLLVCGLVYLAGDQRRPVPAAVGASLSGKGTRSTTSIATLRVASFNIHGGTGRDRRYDLARTAAALNGFDLALLNEVHGPYFWQTEGQVETLAGLTDQRWLFAPTEQRWWHHQFGNAVLSAADVTQWQRIVLPGSGRGYRNAVLLSIPFAGRTLHLLGTHFDRNSAADRAQQFQAVTRLFLALAEPAILLGDLNMTADEGSIRELLARGGVHDPLGEVLGDAAGRHIDWILTRGLTTIDAGTIDNGASDHPLIWAELGVKYKSFTVW